MELSFCNCVTKNVNREEIENNIRRGKMEIKKIVSIILVLISTIAFSQNNTNILSKKLENKLQLILKNGCVLNTGGDRANVLYLKADKIEYIDNAKALKSNEIKNLLKDETSNYYLTNNNEKYFFHVDGIDIWSNEKVSGYLVITKYSMLDYKKEKSWADFDYFPDGILFYKSKLYSLEVTNPKFMDLDNIHSVISNTTELGSLDILGYQLSEYKDIVRIWLYLRNRSNKDIAGFKGNAELFDKFSEPVSYGGGDNSYAFVNSEDIIKTGEITCIGPWEILIAEQTRIIKPHIKKIFFIDGTKLEK
jgi:hypothetical protein